ncbi:putative chloroplast envelope membrane protein, CemA [Helianthus debilis subsp. tardiflorus]
MVYMFLMSSSMVLCYSNLLFSDRIFACRKPLCLDSVIRLSGRRRRGFGRLVPNAKKKHTRKRTWWQKFFFDEDGNWLGLKDDEMLEVEEEAAKSGSDDEGLSENEKFEAWRRRAEALVELREAQENVQNEEERKWEDWLLDGTNGGGGGGNSNGNGSSWFQEPSDESVEGDLSDLIPGKGFTESVRDLVFGREDDEILYEDRVFRYASFNSAKFLAALIIIPWALDFFVHDYVLMPFLDRYVKTVPLAAEILDVRKHQKLEMVKELKTKKERYKFEVEIGKSPPISDEELYLELRHKALELRDEWRLINRSAFANIWSDMVFGISLFVLLYFNQNQVALLKFTGYKIINNISDTGKAFLIILITDIFLGYHSESGWQTLLEIIVDHYGFDVDHSAIIIFVCLIPVVIDACVKLWMFKFLPRLSPKVSNIFQEMKRH